MAHKSSFSRALKPSYFNMYLIELVVCFLISFFTIYTSVKKNIFLQDIKFQLVSFVEPVSIAISKPFELVNETFVFFNNLFNVHEQNELLKKQNEIYKNQINEKNFFEIENFRLKKLLNINEHNYSKKLTGRILADPYARPNANIFIDLGELDGLKINDLVFNENGLIGRVVEIGKKSSEVLSILNVNSVIPVFSLKTKKKFFVQGNKENLKVKHLENEHALRHDELIVSTSAAGYFKAGINIGKVFKTLDEVIIDPFAKKTDSIYVSVLVYNFKDLTNW